MITRSEVSLLTNLREMIDSVSDLHADRPALVHLAHPLDTSPRVVTYSELATAIQSIAAGLSHAGVRAGDSVAILSPTTPESLIAFVASATVAAAFPINPLLTPNALAHQLSLAQARACIVHGADPVLQTRDKLLAALAFEQPLETIVEIKTEHAAITPIPVGICHLTWQELLDRADTLPTNEPDSRRVAALLHTGGTSGKPKLAELGEGALAAGPQLSAAACNFQSDDRLLSFLPHFHVGGTLSVTLATLSRGGSVYTCGKLGGRDPDLIRQIWTLCANHEITLPTMVPTTWSAVLKDAEGDAPKSLRGIMTGGAAAPLELVERAEKQTGVPMSQVFGMTELAGICTAQPVDGVFRPHAVGFAPPGISVALDPVGDGLNEVRISGPNMFLGYRTADGRVDEPGEWLVTGDLGTLDEIGQLRLLGRSKDVIIRSGHNIDPATIEEAAYAHPGVVNAAAVGLPDAYAGEVPILFVVPAADADLSDLESVIAGNIVEPPARPRRIIQIDAMPLTAVGKIERYRLRQRACILRAEELLETMSWVSITCTDPAARSVILGWQSDIDRTVTARADRLLNEVGLRAVHERARASEGSTFGGNS